MVGCKQFPSFGTSQVRNRQIHNTHFETLKFVQKFLRAAYEEVDYYNDDDDNVDVDDNDGYHEICDCSQSPPLSPC